MPMDQSSKIQKKSCSGKGLCLSGCGRELLAYVVCTHCRGGAHSQGNPATGGAEETPVGCHRCPLGSCTRKAPGGSTLGPERRETEGSGGPGSCEPVRGCGRAGGRGAQEGGERAREGAQRARRPAPALPARRPRRLPPLRTAAFCHRRRCSRGALLGSRAAAAAGFVLPAEDGSDLFLIESGLKRE